MNGDDPDPSVTKARVGFGEVFGRTEEGVGGCREVRWSRSRGKQKPDWSGTVSAGKAIRGKVMKAKGETAMTNECKF